MGSTSKICCLFHFLRILRECILSFYWWGMETGSASLLTCKVRKSEDKSYSPGSSLPVPGLRVVSGSVSQVHLFLSVIHHLLEPFLLFGLWFLSWPLSSFDILNSRPSVTPTRSLTVDQSLFLSTSDAHIFMYLKSGSILWSPGSPFFRHFASAGLLEFCETGT